MQDIRTYLQNRILIADGAMGTYLSSLTGRGARACELFNLSDPGLVGRVHREYVQAGARLILTNTFCANTRSLGLAFDEIERILRAGVQIAKGAAGEDAFVAGDIGPIPEDDADPEELAAEYRRIADVFLDEGVRIFQLETFAEAESPTALARYIRSRAPEAFLLISFAVTPDGYSRLGLRAASLLETVRASGAADATGFNCCSGPAHMMSFASRLDFDGLIPSLMPNAGYPEKEDEVLVYSGMPGYFAEKLSEAPGLGFRILGGCCGTTPEHIRQLAWRVGGMAVTGAAPRDQERAKASGTAQRSRFRESLAGAGKTVVVELDPPFDSDLTKLEAAAAAAALAGADALTIADSPMARPRADSVMVAARLRRVTGMDVIPHLCCRDRNINALRSALVAAHMEGVRNVLSVTGDPVSETDRSFVKSVYNVNSAGLCSFLRDLNAEVFGQDPMACGCAFNVNARNTAEEIARLEKKIAAGASFILTQPVFGEEAVQALQSAAGRGVKLLAGILTPLSYKNARFLANEIPGFRLPQWVLDRYSPDMTRGEGEEAGIEISVATAEQVAPLVDGFYFMTPFNRIQVTAKILDRLRAKGIL